MDASEVTGTPESFEVDEPKTRSSERDLVEALSLTIECVDDLTWLLKMQSLGRKARVFD